MIKIKVNGKEHAIDAAPEDRLLWVLRDELKLTGTKYGCGIAQCGACKVHINGIAMPSCIIPLGSVIDADITTIEGIKGEKEELHPVQKAWIDNDVPQCGYCQAGQIMAAIYLIKNNPSPNDLEIDQAMSGNICRCGTYDRIKKAIKSITLK